MRTDRPITIVMYVQDDAKAKEFLAPFFAALGSREDFHGTQVTAMGWEDSISKLEKMEQEELEQD